MPKTHLNCVGYKQSPEHVAWQHIKQRCRNPNCKAWNDYGARGITICEEWANSFETFLHDVGQRPSPKHTIERINNDGHYEPGNVRWATRAEQSRNRRNNHSIMFNGQTFCLSDLAEHLGVRYQDLQYRIARGYPLDKQLSRAVRDSKGRWTI